MAFGLFLPLPSPLTLCPLLAKSGHNLNGEMRGSGLLTLCPLLTQSGHKLPIKTRPIGV